MKGALLLTNLINYILQEPLYQNLLSSIHCALQGMMPEETETEYVKNPEFSTFELSENESRSLVNCNDYETKSSF